MDYPAWKSGKRLVVDGNKTSLGFSGSGSERSMRDVLKTLKNSDDLRWRYSP